MKPIGPEPRFGVCPKCGADTIKVEGFRICKYCGWEEKRSRGAQRSSNSE